MEEDALDRGEVFGEQMRMKNLTAVNNVITRNNFVTPTTDMEMRIRVEELQPEGTKRCYPQVSPMPVESCSGPSATTTASDAIVFRKRW
eukprot:12380265-Heterocapsa_arctica.AAC.1